MSTLRIASIIQLCLAFTLLAWHCLLPFMGELFATKSKMLVYQHLMEKEQFATLPDQQRIVHEYALLQGELETPFMVKIKMVGDKLWRLSLFEKGWILFAIVIPILLLKKVEGAPTTVWILPILTFAYALDNRMNGAPPALTAEQKLFPTEEQILRDYLKEPLHSSPAEQKRQLTEGFQLYLIKEWAKEEPDPALFKTQVERGDFAFNLARIEAIKEQPPLNRVKQEPLGLLTLYLFWNLSFALLVIAEQKIDAYPNKIAQESCP